MSGPLRKFEIINGLARTWRYKAYLEVCTPTTGCTFERVEAKLFDTCERFVYRCPAGDNDGSTYDYRTAHESSDEILNAIWVAKGRSAAYDLIFVDPWHTHAASLEDFAGAWKLLKPGGRLVVHDCCPPSADYATPEFKSGGWCGETYRAFIDFLSFRKDAQFTTVDTDFGCGIVLKLGADERAKHSESLLFCWLQWAALPHSSQAKFEFFRAHQNVLLNLISASDCEALLKKST
jgi:hypothetical protein